MSGRYVVAGLARPRTEWFVEVGRWATEASIPVEFVRCVSVAELRSRLDSGRPFSAVLLADDVVGLDRDLLDRIRAVGAAPVVVGTGARDWPALGAAAVVPTDLDRDGLVEALEATARVVDDATPDGRVREPSAESGRPGRLVAVTGPGGTGASTAAVAIAQGLAGPDGPGAVVLADLRRVAEQAMLHDSRVVVPGLQELVDAHRLRDPDTDVVRQHTFEVTERGYRLLLGLRRSRQWTTLRPTALEAALLGLRRSFEVVVADVDPDVEGERETGSADVEERHLATRLAVARADAVVVVGLPGMKGLYALARLLGELLAFGVPAERLVTVVNRAPRSRRRRSELTRALADLLQGQLGGDRLPSPVFLPDRRIEEAFRDGVALPAPVPEDLADVVTVVLERTAPGDVSAAAAVPVPVAPGSLGIAGDEQDER